MNTVNGRFDLLCLKGSTTEILDFGSGARNKIVISNQKVPFTTFFISPNIYILPDHFYILQNDKLIKVNELISKSGGFILDKFGRTKSYILVDKQENNIGIPDIDIWYDGDLVIRKNI